MAATDAAASPLAARPHTGRPTYIIIIIIIIDIFRVAQTVKTIARTTVLEGR